MTLTKNLAGIATAAVKPKRVWLLQLLGNPLIFGLFVLWLRIPEAKAFHLFANAVVFLLVLIAAVVLHAGTLNAFSAESPGKTGPFRLALSHVVSVLICLAIFYFLWSELDRLESLRNSFPSYLRSEMPRWLRNIVSEGFIDNSFAALLFLLRWVVVPAVLFPIVSRSAMQGWRAWQHSSVATALRSCRSLTWWVVVLAFALLGVWLPGSLVDWRPFSHPPGLTKELLSMVIRLSLAYALAIGAWMLLASGLGETLRQASASTGESAS